MKTERRHDLQNNTLAGWLTKQTQSTGPYTSWIIAGFIAIVLAMVFMKISGSRNEASHMDAWGEIYTLQNQARTAMAAGTTGEHEFNDAMEGLAGIAEEYQGSDLGRLTLFAIGDAHLQRGGASIRQSRQIADDSFENAADCYSQIIDDKSTSAFMVNLARFRRGRAYEWRNQIPDAIADYKATEGPYAAIAQDQLLALDDAGMKQWYEEFDTLNLTTRPASAPQDFQDTPFSEPSDIDKFFNRDDGALGNPLGRSIDLDAGDSNDAAAYPSPATDTPVTDAPVDAEPVDAEPVDEDADSEEKTDDE